MPINLIELKKIQSDVASCKSAKLCVVTKTRPISDIKQLIKLGQKIFAENRVQEAEIKYTEVFKSNSEIKLHLIGPLQSNKVKIALSLFDVIQSIDRPKIVDSIFKICMFAFFFAYLQLAEYLLSLEVEAKRDALCNV